MPYDQPPSVIDGPRNNPLRSDTCERCTHHRGWRICTAFPGGIPDALWNAYHGHREPFPGDHGILFELVKPVTGPLEIPEFLRKNPAQS